MPFITTSETHRGKGLCSKLKTDLRKVLRRMGHTITSRVPGNVGINMLVQASRWRQEKDSLGVQLTQTRRKETKAAAAGRQHAFSGKAFFRPSNRGLYL